MALLSPDSAVLKKDNLLLQKVKMSYTHSLNGLVKHHYKFTHYIK